MLSFLGTIRKHGNRSHEMAHSYPLSGNWIWRRRTLHENKRILYSNAHVGTVQFPKWEKSLEKTWVQFLFYFSHVINFVLRGGQKTTFESQLHVGGPWGSNLDLPAWWLTPYSELSCRIPFLIYYFLTREVSLNLQCHRVSYTSLVHGMTSSHMWCGLHHK